ncbi:glycosyltransferase [Actinomadura craniellae]|nr:glycosyltransferase [Actinomadura craniellae]
MSPPKVSVIVPVYNCRATLERTLRSAFEQSPDVDRIEIIAVDDGSTDGGGELLDKLAAGEPRLRVVHQPNSGGPGAPRNAGIDLARGEYLFFLDADDWLAPGALARMCAMADENGTDIVLGKLVGVGGRNVPAELFRESAARTSVLAPGSRLYQTMPLAALQLFRRSMVEQAGLRFGAGLRSHEDQRFVVGAYLHASLRSGGISVLADHDCYYWSEREDGTSVLQQGGAGAEDVYRTVADVMELVADQVEPGPDRDGLLHRHLRIDVFGRIQRRYLDLPDDERRRTREGARRLLDAWLTPRIAAWLPPHWRLIAHCLQHDRTDPLADILAAHRAGRPPEERDGDRIFLRYPHFRDPAVAIPDECYEVVREIPLGVLVDEVSWAARGRLAIRGHVPVRLPPGARPQVSVRLRLREPREDVLATVTLDRQDDRITLVAECDLSDLRPGRWDLFAEVAAGRPASRTRIPAPEGLALPDRAATSRLRRALPYRTVKGGLSVHVTEPVIARRALRPARAARRVLGRGLAGSARGAAALAAGRPALAARLVRERRLRADLLGAAADRDLADGRRPRDPVAAYAAELACADASLRAGEPGAAAASFLRATELAFHRVLHIDRLDSPLDAAPEKYTGPLLRSAVGRALAAPRGRSAPPAPPPGDGRPLRLLVVTRANANFLGEIRDRYGDHPGVEFRFLDLAEDPVLAPLAKGLRRMVEFALGGQPGYGRRLEEALRPYLDWADTVFVEWCTASAALFTLVDPGATRVVVRLHKFEAYTHWPHLVDFSRVDDLVFVSEPMRDLAAAVLPRLRGADAPRVHVVPNAMDLRTFHRPKRPEARFTLGLVGLGQVAKDPRWALDVLRALRAHDPRYRLLVVGGDLRPTGTAAAARYLDLLQRDFAELEPDGAVRRLGHRDDMPAVMTEIGVILSGSVRESFHCVVAEGAASGAVPVVRDWPCFAGRPRGARAIFPAEWVVGTPREAVDRILALTADEDVWAAAGAAAAEHALCTWDWTVVQHEFDRLLLGDRIVERIP